MLAELPLFCDYCKRAMQRPTRKYFQESVEAARSAGSSGTLRLCNSCFQRLRQMEFRALAAEVKKISQRESGTLDWGEFREQVVPLRDGEGPVLSGEEDPRWVQCECCHLWFHFVCGLYDEQSLKDSNARFFCSGCIDEDPGKRASASWAKHPAESLPHTHLSRHIEEWVARDLRNVGVTHEPIKVRLISSVFEQSHCPEEMVGRMHALGGPYPSEFPYRSKAVVAFQQRDGIDVAFFAMYVQEYGDDCPEPNKNRVYISYLDSVRYFESQPGGQRTLVYHTILVAYLAYVRTLGFKWVHIWVEPPKAGDEYIFFARPDQHKRPMKRDKLRAWYVGMLERAKERGIIQKFGSMAEVYSEMTSIREIPMFHGDQWAITIPELLNRIEQEQQEADAKSAGGTGGKLQTLHAGEVVQRAQQEIQHLKRHFLVAQIKELDTSPKTDLDPEVTNELANSREVLLGHCQASHWQFNSLRYAQYSSMMLLNNFHRKPRRFCTAACTRGRKEDGSKMIGCDVCDNWFHTECVAITAEQAERMQSYICTQCFAAGGFGDASSLRPSPRNTEIETDSGSPLRLQALLPPADTSAVAALLAGAATAAPATAPTATPVAAPAVKEEHPAAPAVKEEGAATATGREGGTRN
mmetsp:Transcript_4510/g.10883  ORF Transcript_4510/g.10883 Transcript_4510/m.10883 type:complete len:638 (+) Transcript_4510:230-2143(+)